MSSVKSHYDNHLGNFYSWMVGDFHQKQQLQESLFNELGVIPSGNRQALDLGAGHGLQTVSLLNLGFNVTAVDFNQPLLNELNQRALGKATVVNDDIKNVSRFVSLQPELIVCCGDTLTHLESLSEIEIFLSGCSQILSPGGKLVLSFRDFSTMEVGSKMEIPVKTDETRKLICQLECSETRVAVTDILSEKKQNNWVETRSTYYKTRVSREWVISKLELNGLLVPDSRVQQQMVVLVAKKP